MGQVLISCGIGAVAGALILGYLSTKIFSDSLIIMLSSTVGGIAGALIVYNIIKRLVSAGV